MAGQSVTNGMQEVFIQLHIVEPQDTERAIKAIESLGARILHGYPPYALVASIRAEEIDQLRRLPGIETVDTGKISEERLQRASSERRFAMMTWNEHLDRRGRTVEQAEPSRDLPWDAPGRLPPDPPPHIRERLRRREKAMQSGQQSEQQEKEDE